MVVCRKELRILGKRLDQLMEIVRNVESGELPYFYRHLDTMSNNIDIFFFIDCIDVKSLCEILWRDWNEANFVLLGIQDYDLRRTKPDVEQTVCVHFARLIGEVESFLLKCLENGRCLCLCSNDGLCSIHCTPVE